MVLPVLSLNLCHCNAENLLEIIQTLHEILPGSILCVQEVDRWPAGTEFSETFGCSVYRRAECRTAIIATSAWASRITSWDANNRCAWVFLNIKIVILSIYLPDVKKPIEEFFAATVMLDELLSSEPFKGYATVLVGDLNVELPAFVGGHLRFQSQGAAENRS